MAAERTKLNLKIGDKIQLKSGKIGYVKFIGETHFIEGGIIGLELDEWFTNGHNGTIDGKKYFNAQKGKGYFATRDAVQNIMKLNTKKSDNQSTAATQRRSKSRSRSLSPSSDIDS